MNIFCPYCNAELDEHARDCHICKENLITNCPYCKEEIRVFHKICPHCKTELIKKIGYKKENLKILTTISYILVLISVLTPILLSNSLSNHHAFWRELLAKGEDYIDLISTLISCLVIACTPSIVSICFNYRKRVSAIIIGVIFIFFVINSVLILHFLLNK